MADPGYSYQPSDTSQSVVSEQKSRVLQALKGSASWFLMIAGLSVVNSILALSGAKVRFIFGLGFSQIVDSLAHQAGSSGYVLDLIINGIIAGVFVLFWNFARQGQKWAWYLGMAIYAVDGVLLLLFKDYFAIAFHAYALYRMSSGLKLLPILDRLNQQSTTGAISSSY
jgi:sterol desaturase/sphingolipid hydroxylase (fatty acid hydroxylase superfamily)